jgi:hypothetical protein
MPAPVADPGKKAVQEPARAHRAEVRSRLGAIRVPAGLGRRGNDYHAFCLAPRPCAGGGLPQGKRQFDELAQRFLREIPGYP